MSNSIRVELTNDLWTFVERNFGAGTSFSNASEFVCDLIRQRMVQEEADNNVRNAIVEGYQDAIEGRTVVFKGNLRSLLENRRK